MTYDHLIPRSRGGKTIWENIVEPILIKIGYANEQATGHRRPPANTPPLPARP